VEFKKLGEVAELSRGKVYSKDYLSKHLGKYPVYSSQTANDGQLGCIDTYDFDGDYLTWTTDGAYAGTIFHRIGKFSITNVCGLINLKSDYILLRFLYYWLSITACKYVYQGMGNPKLMSNQMAEVEIPLPPLPIQEEIVRILDRFAEYAAELQAELQARKEQYEYYRNRLLSFNPSASGSGIDDVDKNDVTGWGGHSYDICWKTMGEICSFKYGYTDKAKDKGTARYIRITDINEDGYLSPKDKKYVDLADDNKQYMAKKGDLLMARTGATFGKTLYVDSEEPAIYASFLIKITFNTDEIMNRFYWHYSKSKFYWLQANKLVSTGGQPQFNANALAQLVIPIPPLAEQQRIVSILDRFESLVNDLTAGLPAEIEARRQQYEYYRNQLLTFKRLA
jgi:type I restriction enzyme S subunit